VHERVSAVRVVGDSAGYSPALHPRKTRLCSRDIRAVIWAWFGVGSSVDDHQPKDPQGFEQVRILFSYFPRFGPKNGKSIRQSPVLEDCPVLNRVAVARVVEDSRVSEFERDPAGLSCQSARFGRSRELRSMSSIPSFTAIPASANLRSLTPICRAWIFGGSLVWMCPSVGIQVARQLDSRRSVVSTGRYTRSDGASVLG
jgi:hypothetical protein